MKELDLLKRDWQKDTAFKQVSELEIYKMLHKKSSSIVKWIFIISILEILLWTSVSVFYDTDDFLKNIKSEGLNIFFQALTYFNYAVILVFIYLFYKNYVAITTTASTKQLMKDILKTRKTVQYYVWYNLGMAGFCMILGFFMAFNYNPETVASMSKIQNNSMVMVITIALLVLITGAIIGLFWLFYHIVYGILLKKLFANYKELRKIDL